MPLFQLRWAITDRPASLLGHQVQPHIGVLLRRAFQDIHAGLHMATAAPAAAESG
jgi:hypothetical protein